MSDDSRSDLPASSKRFSVLTNPVRGFAERVVARARPGRDVPVAVTGSTPSLVGELPDVTPAQSFVTSEVISAFHLQNVHLPSGVERATKGAVTGGKVAIIASAFALISLIGFDFWSSSPAPAQGAAEAMGDAPPTVSASGMNVGTMTNSTPPVPQVNAATPAPALADATAPTLTSKPNEGGAMARTPPQALEPTRATSKNQVRPSESLSASRQSPAASQSPPAQDKGLQLPTVTVGSPVIHPEQSKSPVLIESQPPIEATVLVESAELVESQVPRQTSAASATPPKNTATTLDDKALPKVPRIRPDR